MFPALIEAYLHIGSAKLGIILVYIWFDGMWYEMSYLH